MKKFQITMILVALLGMIHATSAQRVVKVYPKHGTVVRTVHKPKILIHQGVSFHFSDGVWYKPNHGSFVVCAAPRGVFVKRLPRGRAVVRINGRKLYKYKGVVYQKKRGGYVVVHV